MNQTKPKTRETIEYEKGLKTLHELRLKSELSQEGIDTSKIPRKKLDDFRRLLDKQGHVHQKHQAIITKAQQEANAIITKAQQESSVTITKAQQEMQAEFAEIQKEGEEIIKSIKIEQGIIIPVPEVPQTAPETEPKKEGVEEEVKTEPGAEESQGDEK